MKQLFCALLLLSIFSCTTTSNQPTTATLVENYVKSQMKDPSSFQLIKNEVVDTVMMNKFLIDRYNEDTLKVTQNLRDNEIAVLAQNFESDEKAAKEKYQTQLDKNTKIYRELAARDSLEISKHAPDKIFYISYAVSYRAKNSYGALDFGKATVNYYPTNSSFKMVNQ